MTRRDGRVMGLGLKTRCQGLGNHLFSTPQFLPHSGFDEFEVLCIVGVENKCLRHRVFSRPTSTHTHPIPPHYVGGRAQQS